MYNLNWSRAELTRQKLGAFGEYYAKMTMLSYGVSIYTAEVDDHGIDFVAETKRGFLKFQVKTIRQNTNYVFMQKKYFNTEDQNLFLFLSILTDGEHPMSYMIPAAAWKNDPSGMFTYYAYEDKKSESEYGLNLSKKNMPLLEQYELEKVIGQWIG